MSSPRQNRMLSVTVLSSYLYCPRKLFLERVLRLSEPPKSALVLGTIRHETLEAANKEEPELVINLTHNQARENIIDRFQQRYQALLKQSIRNNKDGLRKVDVDPLDAYQHSLRSILAESKSRALNVYQFMHAHDLAGQELWQRLTPKITAERKLQSEDLQLRGIIDQIHHYDHGDIPVELKTGRAPQEGVWPGHRIQAAAYALLLEEHTKKPITEARVHYLDQDSMRSITINPFMKMEIKQLIMEVRELLDNRLLPDFCQQRGKCDACGLREQCYNQQRMEELALSVPTSSL